MKKLHLLFFFVATLCSAQENPFYIGHSLVNFNMPRMVDGLADDGNKISNFGVQVINGSTIQNNFSNSASAQGTPYTSAFPAGNFSKLIITEAIPLQNHLTWSDTYTYANNFYNYAKNNNNNNPIKFYIYETWHCIYSGTSQPNTVYGCYYDETQNSTLLWHPRLQADFSLWTGIVNHVRNQNPNDTQIWMIPAGQALYNLTTLINEGSVPGISNIAELFEDDIHLNNKGNYFVACVMYSCIFEDSPQGLTTDLSNEWNIPYTDMPTATQAAIMQQVAWETVMSLSSWTGIQSLSSSQFDTDNSAFHFSLSNDSLSLHFKGNETKNITIFNLLGQNLTSKMTNDQSTTIDVSTFADGIYYIKNNQKTIGKFIK